MNVIYKYEIKETVCIPVGSIILDAQMQRGVPVLWAIVYDPKQLGKRTLKFKVLPTGGEFDSDYLSGYNHFGTLQDNAGFVWHYFVKEE